MTPKRPISPLRLSILAAAIVLAFVWALPAFAFGTTEETEKTFGDPRSFTLVCRENRTIPLTWSGEVDSQSRVLPQLPNEFKVVHAPNPGSCSLFVLTDAYINDQYAWGGRHEIQVDPNSGPGQSFGGSHPGEPGSLDDLNGDFDHPGKNNIRIVVELRLQVTTPGTAFIEWKGGPMIVKTMDADGDSDGIPENKQIFPVHTGLVAVPLAIVAGGLTGFEVRRRQRKRNQP